MTKKSGNQVQSHDIRPLSVYYLHLYFTRKNCVSYYSFNVLYKRQNTPGPSALTTAH